MNDYINKDKVKKVESNNPVQRDPSQFIYIGKLISKRNDALQDIMIAKDKLYDSEAMIFNYLVDSHYFEYFKIDYSKLKRDVFNLK